MPWTSRGGTGTWSNWAGTALVEPVTTARPADPAEAAEVVVAAREAGRNVRPLGSGHSFTRIGAPEPARDRSSAVALDLANWSGISHADTESGLVTVRAGTPLHRLNTELDALGLAMPNLGDIDRQTLAGAIATGTHGTGAELGGLATQVHALELVLADGSARTCSASENPELFDAARIGLGALGLVSSITLQCVPAFALAAEERPEPLDQVLESFDELAERNDHVEFYWFPHGSNTLVKRNNRLEPGLRPQPLRPLRHFVEYELLENRLFAAVCGLGRRLPRAVAPLNKLCGAAWSARSYSDTSHRVFVTSRKVPFVESEYAVPAEALGEVIGELRRAVSRLDHPVMFPVEVRVAAADEVWLSTAHHRPTAYIAVHQYAGMPYRQWFDTFEAVALAAGGRPHWGKMHSLDAETLRQRYPRFDDFRRMRDTLDPDRVFGNPHLERILGD